MFLSQIPKVTWLPLLNPNADCTAPPIVLSLSQPAVALYLLVSVPPWHIITISLTYSIC